LLLKLEHESVGVRIASKKQAVQAVLKGKRDEVKRLQGRLQELDERYQNVEEEESDEEEEEPKQEQGKRQLPTTISEKPAVDSPSSNLRSRRGDPSWNEKSEGAYTTSSYHHPPNHSKHEPNIQSKEQILSSDRANHETILEQMLSLTSELKSSASSFHTTLKSDEKHVDSAFQGMEKNSDGMEIASGRMSSLRTLTEGKGWWGRMILYGYIAGLWVLALVIVFILPKLRF
jgi:hypothetical protein